MTTSWDRLSRPSVRRRDVQTWSKVQKLSAEFTVVVHLPLTCIVRPKWEVSHLLVRPPLLRLPASHRTQVSMPAGMCRIDNHRTNLGLLSIAEPMQLPCIILLRQATRRTSLLRNRDYRLRFRWLIEFRHPIFSPPRWHNSTLTSR